MAKFIDNAEVCNLKYDPDLRVYYCDKCGNALDIRVARDACGCPKCKKPMNKIDPLPERTVQVDEDLIKF